MGDNQESLCSVESRHRKEKKELQAQIQALKKAAKNDKTKKKELINEIARLETELDVRHKQEIEAFGNIDETDEAEELIEMETTRTKVSKAQRRRDKKSQQEKQREEDIKLQDKENLQGPRNMEMLTITTKLKQKNLQIMPIPSDGDCLYKAISHQMELTRQTMMDIDKLRKNVSDYIKQNKEDFIPFMSNPDTSDMLTDIEFDIYCNKIRDTKVWGGQLEIKALSNLLKCPISVIQATGPDSIEQGTEFEGPPLLITYHRHMYSLGEHYNSTCPVDVINR